MSRLKTELIGLTGGAGSGKSTVAAVFKGHGACIVDADKIGHRLLEKNHRCTARVIKEFDTGILSPKGSIDRAKLGGLVFSDKAKMLKFNEIVHPYLLKEIKKEIDLCRVKYFDRPIVVDAALIVQWGLEKELGQIIMVDSLKKLRIARLIKRGISGSKAQKIISSQQPMSEIRKKSDIVIKNNGSIKELESKAAEIWEKINKKISKDRQKKVEI
jgi:dephospho-CoA kinase